MTWNTDCIASKTVVIGAVRIVFARRRSSRHFPGKWETSDRTGESNTDGLASRGKSAPRATEAGRFRHLFVDAIYGTTGTTK